MFKNEKNKILTCFFQAVFFSRKKPFFSEKNKLVFFGLQPDNKKEKKFYRLSLDYDKGHLHINLKRRAKGRFHYPKS